MKQKRDAKGRFLPKEQVYATGIKGFKKGLVCEPAPGHKKKYKENTVFEEKGGKICGHGVMHAAESVVNALDYIRLVNRDGTLSEFARVEALAPIQREGNKWATTKLRVGNKLSFEEFVKECVICSDGSKVIGSSTFGEKLSSTCNEVVIASSGDYVKIGSSGEYVAVCSSGDNVSISCSGDCAEIANSGKRAQISVASAFARINSSGYQDKIASTGVDTKIVSSGSAAVIAAIGNDSGVAAELGSWIGLAEYDNYGNCLCAKFALVDGVKLKPKVCYKLVRGRFVESD